MVDPDLCPTVADFKYSSVDDYTYNVIARSHSAEARRQLVKEYPLTLFFKYAECKVCVGLEYQPRLKPKSCRQPTRKTILVNSLNIPLWATLVNNPEGCTSI